MSRPKLPRGFKWMVDPYCEAGCHEQGPAVRYVGSSGGYAWCLDCCLHSLHMEPETYRRLKALRPTKFVVLLGGKPKAVVSSRRQGNKVIKAWLDSFASARPTEDMYGMTELEYHKPDA